VDPITSLLTGHIAGKVIDFVGSNFKSSVIERWSKRRAESFFDEFCREIEIELAGRRSEELDEMLNHILTDETCSEVLFDAYRRVTFTKSKDIGPRIIGIITAELVVKERNANRVEEVMLSAAESLSDAELLEYASFVKEHQAKVASVGKKNDIFVENGCLKIKWYKEQIDSRSHSSDVSIAQMDLDEVLGSWAAKSKDCGILIEDMKERTWHYREDGERHIDEDGSVREISWWLYVPQSYFRLVELIERVSPAAVVPDN
jgi:hypothetical protein